MQPTPQASGLRVAPAPAQGQGAALSSALPSGAHPRDVLLGAQAQTEFLPVCDHYSGVEARMRKSLQLQAEMAQELGACVFDVTLDCEDGAPVGFEAGHARLVASLALAAGGNIWEAACLGSVAAGIQVGRQGNVPLSADDIVACLQHWR